MHPISEAVKLWCLIGCDPNAARKRRPQTCSCRPNETGKGMRKFLKLLQCDFGREFTARHSLQRFWWLLLAVVIDERQAEVRWRVLSDSYWTTREPELHQNLLQEWEGFDRRMDRTNRYIKIKKDYFNGLDTADLATVGRRHGAKDVARRHIGKLGISLIWLLIIKGVVSGPRNAMIFRYSILPLSGEPSYSSSPNILCWPWSI